MRAAARKAVSLGLLPAARATSVRAPTLARAEATPLRTLAHQRVNARRLHDANSIPPEDRRRAMMMSAPLGFLAGAFGSCVGVGGGALVVPVLASATAAPQRVLSGTTLVAVVSTAIVSASRFGSEGLIDLEAAAILGGAAMLSAPMGARLTAKMNCEALRRTLAFFLLFAAPLVPMKALAFKMKESDENMKDKVRAFDAKSSAPQLVAIGMTAGVASGLLGIGGGTIVTPLLALVTPLPQAAVLGTSLLAMIPPSVVALATHHRMGNVEPRMGAALAFGTALGSAFGSSFAVDAPRGALEAMFFFGMLFLSRSTFRALKKL